MGWDEAVLCEDADLTAWEARMPELAQSVTGPSGKSVYDGKRDLAKKRIARMLVDRGLNPQGITNPSQLKDAATFLELSLIFRDMAFRDDTPSADKAHYYYREYQEEVDGIQLDYEEPDPWVEPATKVFGNISIHRG